MNKKQFIFMLGALVIASSIAGYIVQTTLIIPMTEQVRILEKSIRKVDNQEDGLSLRELIKGMEITEDLVIRPTADYVDILKVAGTYYSKGHEFEVLDTEISEVNLDGETVFITHFKLRGKFAPMQSFLVKIEYQRIGVLREIRFYKIKNRRTKKEELILEFDHCQLVKQR